MRTGSARRGTRARIPLPLTAALLVVVLAGCSMGQKAARVDAHPASLERSRIAELLRASDEVMTSRVDPAHPGCSAAVAIEGEVAWAGAAGLADLAAGIPITTETRFDMASVAKQFTATAILMLQRDGLLSVSDPVARYVDGLPEWGETVTLDQLIHHTSRIPDFWVELDDVGIGFSDPATQQDTLEAIAREDELDEGDGYSYSNSNYVLLAEVVATVSGLALPDFLAQRVFGPLGLDMVVAPTLQGADIARSYDDAMQLQESGWQAYGHVGILSTPSELAHWGDQYRTGDIVQDDFAVGAVDEGFDELYAAGIDIEVDGDLNHTGRWGGYITDFTVSAERVTSIAVMCNGHAADRWGIADALWELWDPRPSTGAR